MTSAKDVKARGLKRQKGKKKRGRKSEREWSAKMTLKKCANPSCNPSKSLKIKIASSLR